MKKDAFYDEFQLFKIGFYLKNLLILFIKNTNRMKKTNAFFTNITMYSYIRIPLNQLQIMNQKFKRNVFFLFLFLFFGIGNFNAQQDVFSRSEVSTGNWWDSALHGFIKPGIIIKIVLIIMLQLEIL